MKGTPLGHELRGRGRAVAGATIAAGVLALAAPSADAANLTVTNTRADGKGSFAAAVKRAAVKSNLDTIRFEGDLRGRIPIRHDMRLPSNVQILGNGYGRGKREGRVVLRGPKAGATLVFSKGKTHELEELYLDRVAVEGAFEEFESQHLKITDSTISGDGRVDGPGVRVSHDGRYADPGMTISQTTVEGWETGVIVDSTDVRIGRSIVRDNVGGGGVVSAAYSDVDVVNSTISGNELDVSGYPFGGAGARGGYYGGVDLFNTTVTGNRAVGEGAYGGAVAYNVEVFQSTLSGNSAPTGGAIGGTGDALDGEVYVSNSIVAGNTATDPGGAPDCSAPAEFRSRGGNLIGDAGDCTTKSTDLIGADPLLGRLRNNGGPTPTMALGKRSPAIGLALLKEATKADQRGVKRDKHPDAGAYERR